MNKILEKINAEILAYQSLDDELTFRDTEILSAILKNLSSQLFFLENYRNEYSKAFNSIMYNCIKENMPVSKAEIEARQQVPEMYMIRRFMTSAYKVCDSIRTNISFLKNEK